MVERMRGTRIGEDVVDAAEAVRLGLRGVACVLGVLSAEHVHPEASAAAHARPRERVA
jgi:hypothetical protein